MQELDLLSDTVLRDRAIEVLDEFIHARDCPVERSQIIGLRQIAFNEFRSVPEFANKQGERARKQLKQAEEERADVLTRLSRAAGERAEMLESRRQKLDEKIGKLQGHVDFWQLVKELCTHGKSPQHWSLEKEAEGLLPAEFRLDEAAVAGLSRQARRDYKERRQQYLDRLKQQLAPAFFQRFCAHYLYRKP
jgi:hypothetical protein